MDATSIDIAYLYRRAGFGARPADLVAASKVGYERTVEQWISGLSRPDPAASAFPPPPTISLGQVILAKGAEHMQLIDEALTRWPEIIQWWTARMVAAENPLTEKVPLLMHNLFPTAIAKVICPENMLVQNELFRSNGWGRFNELTWLIAHDPAMLMWLDVIQGPGAPNENFARELMERFTMGVGNYTQDDVVAGAACFAGVSFDPHTNRPVFEKISGAPPQTFLGHTGVTTPRQVVEIITHSPASHAYVPSRLWSWLAWPVAPSDPVVATLSGSYSSDLDIADLLRKIFLHPEFRSSSARNGLVKQPIEYVAGVLRALRFPPTQIAAGQPQLYDALAGMGQIPFDPPSVGGWGQDVTWLSSAAALARWRFATDMAADGSADFATVTDASPSDRPEAAAELLSVPAWGSSTASALKAVKKNPESVMTLAMISPEYVMN